MLGLCAHCDEYATLDLRRLQAIDRTLRRKPNRFVEFNFVPDNCSIPRYRC